jgi:hypothetical protein
MRVNHKVIDNTLVFSADATAVASELARYRAGEISWFEAFYNVFDTATGRGLRWADAEKLGLETFSPVFSTGKRYYSYPNFETTDCLQALADGGTVTFVQR